MARSRHRLTKMITLRGFASQGVLAWANDAAYAFDFPANTARWTASGVATHTALSLVPGWTFSRASTGYALNNAGQLVSFASGAPRITDRGFLAEGSRQNLLLRSQEFDNASWVKAQSSISADAISAPDGTTTADKLIEDTSTSVHDLTQSVTKAASATTYAISVYAKAGERTEVRVGIDAGGSANQAFAIFNLASGTISVAASVAGTFTSASATIEALAGGWYRCVVVATTGTETTVRQRIMLYNGASISYTGDGTSGIYVWGAQLEASSFPSSYIPTTTAAVTRAADLLSIGSVTGLDYPASLYLRFRRGVDTAAAETWFQLDDGTANERVRLGITSADLLEAVMTDGGVDTAAPSVAGALAVGTIYNAAARFKVNDVQACRSGTLGTADVSATVPAAPTNIRFGGGIAAAASCFGYIERAAIFGDLTDANLQSVAP